MIEQSFVCIICIYTSGLVGIQCLTLREKNVDTIIAFKGSLPSEWSWVISKKGRTLTHIDEHDKPLVLHVNTFCFDNWTGSFTYSHWIDINMAFRCEKLFRNIFVKLLKQIINVCTAKSHTVLKQITIYIILSKFAHVVV